MLGPLANASNEPRLAGLAAPAFAVAAGMLLRGAALGRAETLVCAAAIAAGGLHHRYTIAGLERNAVWATVDVRLGSHRRARAHGGPANRAELSNSDPRLVTMKKRCE